MERFKQKLSSEIGATLVETGVMIALCTIVAAIGVNKFGGQIGKRYCHLVANNHEVGGDEGKGLSRITGMEGYTWDSASKSCKAPISGWGGDGGGGFD